MEGIQCHRRTVGDPEVDGRTGGHGPDPGGCGSQKNNTLVPRSTQLCGPPIRLRQYDSSLGRDFQMAPGVQKDEILLHEMVHGVRQMEGTVDFHTPLDAPHYDTVEEFMAIVVSNVYRSEMKRPGLRQDHWAFNNLPAIQEDPKKFLAVPGVGGESNLTRMQRFKKDNTDFFNDLKRVRRLLILSSCCNRQTRLSMPPALIPVHYHRLKRSHELADAVLTFFRGAMDEQETGAHPGMVDIPIHEGGVIAQETRDAPHSSRRPSRPLCREIPLRRRGHPTAADSGCHPRPRRPLKRLLRFRSGRLRREDRNDVVQRVKQT